MATLYYISAGGVETAFAASGCSGLTIHRRTGAVSAASWIHESPFDAAPLWPYGTYVTLLRKTGGVSETLFQGWVTRAEGAGGADGEAILYTASDAWWHFEREIYRASRATVDANGDPQSSTTGRALLGMAADGGRLTAAQTALAARSFAASIGITVAEGSYDAPVLPPWDEVVDRTIAEIILRVLRWQPDAVCWIDHATVPPTLNVTRRSNMTSADVALSGLEECRVRALPELQIPGVVISFEFSNDHGHTVSQQAAGNPAALGCARLTVPLEFEAFEPGPRQEIKTVPLGDTSSLAWWQRMFPWLTASATISNVTITPEVPEDYDQILTGGVIQQWMQDELELGAGEFRVACTVKDTVDGRTFEKQLFRDFTLTNALTRRYIGRSDPGWTEPEPAGLAAAFYAAASPLQYGGQFVIIEDECSAGRTLLGKRVNVTGGLTAWASMGAPAVEVAEDFDSGKTTVTLGPQQHLGIQDMVELVRCSRLRSRWIPLDPLDAGEAEESADEVDPFAPEARLAESPGKLSSLEITEQ